MGSSLFVLASGGIQKVQLVLCLPVLAQVGLHVLLGQAFDLHDAPDLCGRSIPDPQLFDRKEMRMQLRGPTQLLPLALQCLLCLLLLNGRLHSLLCQLLLNGRLHSLLCQLLLNGR